MICFPEQLSDQVYHKINDANWNEQIQHQNSPIRLFFITWKKFEHKSCNQNIDHIKT